MNIYQRIVLILGALALLVLGLNIENLFNEYSIYFIIYFLAGMLTIIGTTLLLFFALKGIKKEKE
ncbi:MAG: hypothetical protein COY75_05475 [Nitrospirae bacterium CG_4_10_14_0_8_um_filter_41_23]|nr:MAG: hypothetical protein COS27_08905 [Nitrospirae bacterium CG02_land_8_20_14_3_00_41_53]PIW86322.1 MAG: hypothetical protein COZ94_11095 [Nitrospirae bacterium CG_4_8_14_3_um_filter_41_47]PIY86942.1 MAG: hypothetical protein COY75_05475 [Nitrospirae bacterium CG_4_10_14_0_8_um_filter_41_23]PJB21758.1 MAG: hypothetical protein CO114_03650 [Euryarchaeota archaeon CG_4_9_14_3_um_filter_38_12]